MLTAMMANAANKQRLPHSREFRGVACLLKVEAEAGKDRGVSIRRVYICPRALVTPGAAASDLEDPAASSGVARIGLAC
jgi:hypothetical protein